MKLILKRFFFFYQTVPPIQIQTVYTSPLNIYSPTNYMPCDEYIEYYEIVSLHVHKDGYYVFFVNSTAKVFADLYKNYFEPLNHEKNLIFHHCGISGEISSPVDLFEFTVHLRQNETYMIKITTIFPKKRSSFSIVATGSFNVTFNRISKYRYIFM